MNAKDAATLGAKINVNTKVISANKENGLWRVETKNLMTNKREEFLSKVLINAGGPWVSDLLLNVLRVNSSEKVRLVRGSHIVVPKMWSHEKSYFFQGNDGRIIFAIPYETDFTLIGTTEIDHLDLNEKPKCTELEKNYLINFANQYFDPELKVEDIVWTYSGVRPLQDTSEDNATSVTRDYSIKVNWVKGIMKIEGTKANRTNARVVFSLTTYFTPSIKSSEKVCLDDSTILFVGIFIGMTINVTRKNDIA